MSKTITFTQTAEDVEKAETNSKNYDHIKIETILKKLPEGVEIQLNTYMSGFNRISEVEVISKPIPCDDALVDSIVHELNAILNRIDGSPTLLINS